MIPFIKAHGLGNDFVILEKSDQFLITPLLIKRIADRKRGVGCDQVIVYSQKSTDSYKVFFFNADGSEAEACGNGTRALALMILFTETYPSPVVIFKVKNQNLKVRKISADTIEVEMPPPKFNWQEVPQAKESLIELPIQEGQISPYYTVNLGNPHLISFVEKSDHIPISVVGPFLENHPLFPRRINVTFAEILNSHVLKIAVWERGSGLTEACGTAACAAAVVAIEEGLLANPVVVAQKGGELLINWSHGLLKMIGPAAFSYKGELDFSCLS